MAIRKKKSNYVSLNAASKILNVSSETLRNWDKHGKLKASRNPINNYRLYDLEDLQALASEFQVSEPMPTYSTLFDNAVSLRMAIKNMSKAFRDSEGGSLLDRFEEISKLLFCKLHDEEFNNGKMFSSIDRKQNDEEIYNYIEKLFTNAIKKHPTVFVGGRAKLSNDKKAICQVALVLKNYELKNIDNDVKGKIYEELIKNTLDKNENQQFFTPRNIAQFIIDIVEPEATYKMCDPACGSGGFLISTLEYIKRTDSVDPFEYSKKNLLGIEIDSRMVWIAQMNIILHGGHYESIQYLKGGGSLSYSKEGVEKLPNNFVDIIMTNPPFGSDYEMPSDLNQFELGKGKKSRRRGVLFTEKCLKMLKPGGRLAIILEESILNNSSNEDVRKYLTSNAKIEAIISLPDSAFMPYAAVKTSIVIATKKKIGGIKRNDGILMCNVDNIGFGPNGDPIYSDERDETGKLTLRSDLPETLEVYREFIRTGKLQHPSDKYFVTIVNRNKGNERLDTLFHHPSKQVAQTFLNSTKHPLFPIGELVTIINKLVVPQHEMPEDILRYIGLANISSFDGTYYVSEIVGEKIKSAVKLFEPNTIIYSKMRPELRKVIYIPPGEEAGFVSSECYVFKTTTQILPQYLALLLRSDLVFGQIIFQVTGLGRPRIGKEELLSVKIPVPSIDKQGEIVSIFNAYGANRNALLEKSKMLQQQADHIVKRSFEEIGTTLCH